MKLIQLSLMGILFSTPAWAYLDSGGELIWGSIILMIPAMILMGGGWGPIAVWVGALPAMGMIYGFLVIFNFTGEHPRQESIFTSNRNYHISVRESARLDAIHQGPDCNKGNNLYNECNKDYVKCYRDNLCSGKFKQVYADRARELAANPNAFRPGSQRCREETPSSNEVNERYKCW
ncbi:hypothetical protein UFOVP29_287 [uncultured Caudovirales phage]|uniref:Uncharacterized protein n=1 Tax=uncultured Caudovirales phage TaxID=2100421 RepID=A0A6J5KLM1_9CAUD|nr:hypothetical protein UFOVP29_287 [uncultured Caudovirales phage]